MDRIAQHGLIITGFLRAQQCMVHQTDVNVFLDSLGSEEVITPVYSQ